MSKEDAATGGRARRVLQVQHTSAVLSPGAQRGAHEADAGCLVLLSLPALQRGSMGLQPPEEEPAPAA
jgi:hypothetical protein